MENNKGVVDELTGVVVQEYEQIEEKNQDPLAVKDILPEGEIALLKAAEKNSDDFATAIYQASGLCMHSAIKARDSLIKKGYLIPKRLDIGRRGAKPLMLILTSKAKDLLRSIGEQVRESNGRGTGPSHAFFRPEDRGVLQYPWLRNL